LNVFDALCGNIALNHFSLSWVEFLVLFIGCFLFTVANTRDNELHDSEETEGSRKVKKCIAKGNSSCSDQNTILSSAFYSIKLGFTLCLFGVIFSDELDLSKRVCSSGETAHSLSDASSHDEKVNIGVLMSH